MVLEAAVGAIPATIAAFAAWRSSSKTKQAIKSPNGMSLGYMVYQTHEKLVKHLGDEDRHAGTPEESER